MRISIIIPVFNERKTVEIVINNIIREKNFNKQIIVVDDSSTDGTSEELQKIYANGLIDNLVIHEKNLGKGAAINSAKKYIDGDIVIIQDADLEYSPKDYEKLVNPIINGQADVVYGSRFLTSECHRVIYFWHYVANKFLTLLSNILTNINLSDIETGYKAFRTSIFLKVNIQENRFGFEPEITAKIAKLKCRIYEVGISYDGRSYEEGKKISWIDGLRAIYCIFKYNLLH